MNSLINNPTNYNRPIDDMASAMEMLPEFSNKKSESIVAWTQQLLALQKIYKLNNDITIQIMVKKLKDEAYDTLIDYTLKYENLCVKSICETLNKKYHKK
ncbi:hypothetical protein BDAP_000102 [Binucleata daphniae]